MSLSSWLRDYLYIPLGGNRHGQAMTYRNLLLTMLIGGLWHGANWTFVVWVGVDGVYLAVERMLGVGEGKRAATARPVWQWLGRLGRTLLTFHLVLVAWIFFRAASFTAAFEYLSGLLRFTHMTAVGVVPLLVAVAILAIDIPQNTSDDHVVFLRLPWWVQSTVYAAASFGLVLWGGGEVPFIYFKFG